MLKAMLIAACICPPAALVVRHVEPVRKAVNSYTAAPAKPSASKSGRPTHAFTAPGIAPCIPVGGPLDGFAVSSGYLEGVSSSAFPARPVSPGGGGSVLLPPPPAPGAVPEPATWVSMMVGFGMVGMGIRAARRKEIEA